MAIIIIIIISDSNLAIEKLFSVRRRHAWNAKWLSMASVYYWIDQRRAHELGTCSLIIRYGFESMAEVINSSYL